MNLSRRTAPASSTLTALSTSARADKPADGRLYVDRTGVYCETNFGGNLYQLGPGTARLLVNKLGGGWYTVPQLTPVRGARHRVRGLADRDLVQLPLP
ncbi:hypothetical protein JOF29_003445 [Kribbella aluminosa]|uniref:Uncharacterized protein n=1 Tax=Kribbella aluminosa TaxID=416017 RepID=A0ABS4UL39_9ACTN|nr:hypothetical protein [Kribbella aluminosa]MBP2352362.1 hypothetical protein [Kribbella aluminosa]